MKKLLMLLTITTLILTGCQSNASLKDSKAIATIGNEEVTSNDVFQVLKEKGILSEVLALIDEKILVEKYPLDSEAYVAAKDEIIAEADTYYQGQYGKTLEAMLADNNMTLEDFEDMIKIDILRELAVKDAIKANITDEELVSAYEAVKPEIKASHILITAKLTDADGNAIPEDVAEATALALANEIIAKLDSGEDFSELAKEFSEDGSAASGGDLGFFSFERMVVEFSTAAFALDLNAYTAQPVKSQFGYHIILKTDEKEVLTLEEMKDELTETIIDAKLTADGSLAELTLDAIRKDAGLKFEDSAIEEEYNTMLDSLQQ